VSYRTKLSLGIASTALSVVAVALVGRVVAAAGPGFADRYGMSYTTFALLGAVVHGAASAGLHAFRASVRREQLQGTLEQLLVSGRPAPLLVALSGAGEVLAACAGGAALALVCSRVAGVALPVSPPAVAAAALYVAAMCGLGLASAGVVLVSKEGEPVGWAVGALSSLAGGVYFPVDLLPGWLSTLSRALPTTHALSAVRAAVLASEPGPAPCGTAAAAPLGALALSALLLVALGVLVLRWGFARARRLGTLAEY